MRVKQSMLERRMTVAITASSAKVRARQHEEGTSFKIRRIDAGMLLLPTGRICITDAYSADKYPPLNRIVPEGEYPVELVIAQIPKNLPFGNDRCAFVVVTFAREPVERWEPVTATETAEPCFTPEKPNGIVQGGGTGLFSPEAGLLHFARLHRNFDEHLEWIRSRSQQFGRQDWINYRPAKDKANVVIVEGGMGDGDYECFVGLSKIGRVLRVVVEFAIADSAD
jgi:hypothetical protein